MFFFNEQSTHAPSHPRSPVPVVLGGRQASVVATLMRAFSFFSPNLWPSRLYLVTAYMSYFFLARSDCFDPAFPVGIRCIGVSRPLQMAGETRDFLVCVPVSSNSSYILVYNLPVWFTHCLLDISLVLYAPVVLGGNTRAEGPYILFRGA